MASTSPSPTPDPVEKFSSSSLNTEPPSHFESTGRRDPSNRRGQPYGRGHRSTREQVFQQRGPPPRSFPPGRRTPYWERRSRSPPPRRSSTQNNSYHPRGKPTRTPSPRRYSRQQRSPSPSRSRLNRRRSPQRYPGPSRRSRSPTSTGPAVPADRQRSPLSDRGPGLPPSRQASSRVHSPPRPSPSTSAQPPVPAIEVPTTTCLQGRIVARTAEGFAVAFEDGSAMWLGKPLTQGITPMPVVPRTEDLSRSTRPRNNPIRPMAMAQTRPVAPRESIGDARQNRIADAAPRLNNSDEGEDGEIHGHEGSRVPYTSVHVVRDSKTGYYHSIPRLGLPVDSDFRKAPPELVGFRSPPSQWWDDMRTISDQPEWQKAISDGISAASQEPRRGSLARFRRLYLESAIRLLTDEGQDRWRRWKGAMSGLTTQQWSPETSSADGEIVRAGAWKSRFE